MCSQLMGHLIVPRDSVNESCPCALLSLPPPNYGVLVSTVQKAESEQMGMLLLQ